MVKRRRQHIPTVDAETLHRLMQLMIGQGLIAHYEVPHDLPDDIAVLTARIDEPQQPKR